ncbi:monofunctional biosynthetic peptidoglycan transglycosylase [Methylobacter tundripaludum]|uniref:Biosynthetic peptidoglycan transglycosylase n=1 Tax=Methylobacter tundripaludum (strain ATCC BAA-1195 / DSM 17260 / SV96) TaxID=697282 RepID=G3J281_METTV|nr:Monofunctional biosynthetic peptidoglycan transglycosylase [Methylobacter tundripaludum SV96]
MNAVSNPKLTSLINNLCILARQSRYPNNSSFRSLSIKKMLRKTVLYVLFAFLVSSVGLCVLLRWMPVPTSAFMVYRHFEDLVDDGSYKSIKYSWTGAKKISAYASSAVIAAEDQRFFLHSGFDLHSIQSSIDVYMDGGRLRGASTISQQVAKNLFLTPSKSFVRKGLEVWFTLLIESLWSKERILTVYLNIAEFGDHLFGIEAASQHYFGVHAGQISRSQAALLAATLPNPILLRAAQPSSYLLKRQQWILRQMQNQ